MNGIEIKTEMKGDIAHCVVSGDVAIRNLGTFADHVQDLLNRGHSRLVLDMAQVKYLDSAALGAIIGFIGDARKSGGDITLASLNEAIQRFLSIIVRRGPSPLFGIVVEDVVAALEYFHALDERNANLLESDDTTRLFSEGNRLRREKRIKTALEFYEKSDTLGGPTEERKRVECTYYRGYCLYVLGRYEDAVPVLKRSIELRDQYAPAYRLLAYSLEQNGDLDQAADILEAAHSRFPGDDFKNLRDQLRMRDSVPA